jgi:hypothetical protein
MLATAINLLGLHNIGLIVVCIYARVLVVPACTINQLSQDVICAPLPNVVRVSGIISASVRLEMTRHPFKDDPSSTLRR